MGLYPKGEYPNGDYVCNAWHKWNTAICIIDNPHPGRRHWGPDKDGVYREWDQAGKVSTPGSK